MDFSANHDEFIALVNQNKPMLTKVCNLYADNGHDREDLFQEIVFQLWRSYPTFRGAAKFSTFLYRIALNTALTRIRKERRHAQHHQLHGFPEIAASADETDEQKNNLQQLHQAISRLSQIEKAIVMLYLEEKSYDEIEEILGINQNNLRVKMNRIKEKLRKITKEVGHGTD
jgi:RNA polymerase sigma-70 factor, ECF subfamily